MIKNFYSRSIFFIALFLTIQTTHSIWLATAVMGKIRSIALFLKSQNQNVRQCTPPNLNSTSTQPVSYFNHPNFKILPNLRTKALSTLLRNTSKEETNQLEKIVPKEIGLARKRALFNRAMKTHFSNTTYIHIIKDLEQNDTSLLEILLAEPKFNKNTVCLVTTLLYSAVKNGDVKLLQFLIDNKANITIRSPVSKLNLQHIAAIFNQAECKQILLDSGLSLNDRNFPHNYSAQVLWNNPNLITDQLKKNAYTAIYEIQYLS